MNPLFLRGMFNCQALTAQRVVILRPEKMHTLTYVDTTFRAPFYHLYPPILKTPFHSSVWGMSDFGGLGDSFDLKQGLSWSGDTNQQSVSSLAMLCGTSLATHTLWCDQSQKTDMKPLSFDSWKNWEDHLMLKPGVPTWIRSSWWIKRNNMAKNWSCRFTPLTG